MSWGYDIYTNWPDRDPYNPFGYYNLGPVQIPPPLPVVGMTDRTTGKVWYLVYDTTGARMALTDTAPTAAPLRVYGAWDGPYIGSYGLRLGVDQVTFRGVTGTHLVFDAIDAHNAGNCPIAVPLNSTSVYAVLEALNSANPNAYDRLQYEVLDRSPAAPTGPNQLPGEIIIT